MNDEHEVNFDGIVGPTHNYAGLSYGNVASMSNRASISHPKQAALEGLAKMRLLFDLGVKQAVLPPQERPHLPTLRRFGYGGSDANVLSEVARHDPILLASVSSASSMWAANAATVSPSSDTADARVHFTPANLISNAHRAIETRTTARVLRRIFDDERHFLHHDPLPASPLAGDEGAANHTRLRGATPGANVELFTYGAGGPEEMSAAARFPARQTYRASDAIARFHYLKHPVFVRQNPQAIDAGAFHNDVVAVGHRNVLLYHERAWIDADQCVAALREHVGELRAVAVAEDDVPLELAIKTYLFNSQLVTLADDSIVLIAPVECEENARTANCIRRLIDDGIIAAARFVNVRQSMRNGGGPACLRLRVPLREEELAAIHPGVMFSLSLHDQLRAWIERWYPDELSPSDLADPKLLKLSRGALDALSEMLDLNSIYDFQQA